MKVSIIIPVYNAEKYLRQCLDSLVNQTLDDYEIILINDGSKDSSEAIIQEYKARFPERINAVTVENGGQGRARNIGMELARGEYLGFVDSDDWVAEDMFESMYLAAVESDADICVCDAVECREDGSRTYLPMSACEERARMTTAVWNKLFKKSTLGHLRFPEGLWYEDLAFVIKALFSSGEPARLSRGLYFYRVGQVSTMNNNNARKNLNIISIVDGLKDFLIPQGLREEFETVLVEHLLLDTINRVSAQSAPDREQVIKEIRDYARENIPALRSSRAFKKQNVKRKVIILLNYYGLHDFSSFLFKIKNKKKCAREA